MFNPQASCISFRVCWICFEGGWVGSHWLTIGLGFGAFIKATFIVAFGLHRFNLVLLLYFLLYLGHWYVQVSASAFLSLQCYLTFCPPLSAGALP